MPRRTRSLLAMGCVWLVACLNLASTLCLRAQESPPPGEFSLPGVEDQNPLGDYESNSPYTPVVNFRTLLPASSDVGNVCDPLVFAPNMFGTFTRAPRIGYESGIPVPIVRFQTYRLFADNDGAIAAAQYEGADGTNTINLYYGPPLTLGSSAGPAIALPDGGALTTASPIVGFQAAGFTQQLLENSAVTTAAQTLSLPGEVMVFNPAGSVATVVSGGAVVQYVVDYSYIYTLLGISGLNYSLPNPVDGAVVGRTLVSTNASPLPRSRILYDFDYLSSAQLTGAGVNIHRHVVGVEKTFFGGRSSVTVRVPFASTLDTDIVDGATQAAATEFGNVQIDLKTILYSRPTWLVSGGLGISTPTAGNVRVLNSAGNSTLAQIRNETVVLKPFLAGMWTPNSRLFSQSWMYANFDTSGNPVQFNALGNLTTVGTLNDATGLGFDTQLGYWLISPCESTGWLRGLAPFGELHYLTTLQNTDRVQYGTVSIYDTAGRVDELYATVGAVAQIKTNWNATLGVTMPLLQNDNRFSDWNLGVRFNYFFGGTAASRAAGVNTFGN